MMHLLLASVSSSALMGGVDPDPVESFFKNGGAETGDTSDWTLTGTIEAVSSALDVGQAYKGSYFFFGSDSEASSKMEQVLVVPPSLSSATDSGDCQFLMKWVQGSYGGDDAQPFCQFYDGSEDPIGSEVDGVIKTPKNYHKWAKRNWLVDVPPNARSVRAGLKFTRVAGTELNAYIDEIGNEWFDKSLRPRVSISTLSANWDSSAPDSTSVTAQYSFPAVGEYLVIICGSCATDSSTSIPTFTSFGDANVTATVLSSIETPTSYDFIVALKVEVDVAGIYDIDMECGDGRWYRWCVSCWLVQGVDWANVSYLDLIGPSDLSETVTPEAGSALGVLSSSRLFSGPEDFTGFTEDAFDYTVSLGSTYNEANSFTESDLEGTEMTIESDFTASRFLTLGVFLPPLSS